MARPSAWLLAFRPVAEEPLASIGDPCSLCWQEESSRGRQRICALFALLVHGLLFLIVIPTATRHLTVSQPLVLARLAPPSGGPVAANTFEAETPKAPSPPTATAEPIPMPLLKTPQPVVHSDRLDAQQIQPMEWQGLGLSIGAISGPPSGDQGQTGVRGSGQSGLGPPGDGLVYRGGVGGVSPPELLVQTLPAYTDSAIKARVQGTVLLRVVVRRDGSVDSIQVLRGLGHGLDEKAIEEIANHWKFRPGLRNGQPVDVWATIEVSFSLR